MKVILFDLDDTLFDYSGSERAGAMEFYNHFRDDLNMDLNTFLDMWKILTQKHIQRWANKEITFEQQRLERIREFFGKNMSDKDAENIFNIYSSYFKRNWKRFDDYSAVLDLKRDYKLGIITDGPTSHQTDKLKKIGIIRDFSVIVTSEIAGYSKPDKKIFNHALKKLQCKPSDALYIGDNYEKDYLGAKAAGIFSLHLNRNMLTPDNNHSINTLKQIKDKIDEMHC